MNISILRKQRRIYEKVRRERDPWFAAMRRTRVLLSLNLRKHINGKAVNSPTLEKITGVSNAQLMQHFENESKRLGFRLSDYGKTIEIEHIIPLAKYTELALVTSISNAIEAAFLVSNLTFIDKKSNKKHSTESIALRLFNKQLKAA